MIFVHICCSVDSHYFLQELRKIYPQRKMIGFFYNPNIHPKEEYDLRLLDVERSCKMLNIELIEGDYNDDLWCQEVRGFENEPEKGARCNICFDVRLVESAKMAKQHQCKSFTTTLLSSPMKTQEILFAQGDEIAKQFDLEFIKLDVRSGGGTQKQNELSKKDNLYRQNYCGCKFALSKQREKQNRFPLEFISPLNRQVMAGSIEYRNQIFQKRNALEENHSSYLLLQQKQIVWRCLSGKLECFAEHIPCHIVVNSESKKNVRLGTLFWLQPKKLALKKGKIGYSRRDDTLFLTLDALNELMGAEYKDLNSLFSTPLSYEEELLLRFKVAPIQSICPILIVEREISQDLRLNLESVFQNEKVFEVVEFW